MKTKMYTLKTRNSEYIIADNGKPGTKMFYGTNWPDGVEIENANMAVGMPFCTRFTDTETNIKHGIAGKILRTSDVISIEETELERIKQQEMKKQYLLRTKSGTLYSFEENKNDTINVTCKNKGLYSVPATLVSDVKEGRPFMFTIRNSEEGEKLGLIGKTISTSPIVEIHTIETPVSAPVKQRETIDIDYGNTDSQYQ